MVNTKRSEPQEIRAQPGPQTAFLSSPADIAVFGGSAGGGKSFALELEPLRHATNTPGFSCVIFRRTTPSIRNPGSLWDQSFELYAPVNGVATKHNLEWLWPRGGKIKFAHLEYDHTVRDWHGSQITLLEFDELTEFSQSQFFYMVSRNRSTCGVRPYIRATCNPDADSWVGDFISWWVDQKTGFPILSRAGVLRWFVRIGDEIFWRDQPEEFTHESLGINRYMPDGTEILLLPKSVTFIPATIYDNKKLLEADPGYLANLLSLPEVERERLLRGNWKIKPAAGLMFRREWCEVLDKAPPGLEIKRGWDLAATPKTALNNPDFTCGTKLGRDESGIIYVLDNVRLRGSPAQVESLIREMAIKDGPKVEQQLPQDPAQSGKAQVSYLSRALMGHNIRFSPELGDKEERFNPFSAYSQSGNVKVIKGPWNEAWFQTLESFPDENAHDDEVDSTSRAFNTFTMQLTGLLEYYNREARILIKEQALLSAPPPTTVEEGGIKVMPAAPITALLDQKGRQINPEEDGSFVVTTIHAKILSRNGFTIIEGHVGT